MLADTKDIETDLVGERDRLKQLPQMPRGLDGLTRSWIDGSRYETIYSNLHV
jgi:hypothetical protein